MTTIPTTALIIRAIIIFMLGGFVGVSIMALMNVAKEADKQIGADEGERSKTMREILFRGKRIDNGEWVVGIPWIFSPPVDKAVIVYAMGLVGEDDDISRYCECHEVDPSTIGQYTGMTDKNGKKIFEGDILKYSYHPLVLVVWHSGGWYFTDEDDPSIPHPDDFIDNWGYTDKENLEVIGNIHDNPELLEDKI